MQTKPHPSCKFNSELLFLKNVLKQFVQISANEQKCFFFFPVYFCIYRFVYSFCWRDNGNVQDQPAEQKHLIFWM